MASVEVATCRYSGAVAISRASVSIPRESSVSDASGGRRPRRRARIHLLAAKRTQADHSEGGAQRQDRSSPLYGAKDGGFIRTARQSRVIESTVPHADNREKQGHDRVQRSNPPFELGDDRLQFGTAEVQSIFRDDGGRRSSSPAPNRRVRNLEPSCQLIAAVLVNEAPQAWVV